MNYQGLLMRDQKYLRKNMSKICQLSVKESAMQIIKRHSQDPQKLGCVISGGGPELKLDYHTSLVSHMSENPLFAHQSSMNPLESPGVGSYSGGVPSFM